jgi:hypothetical protein
VGGCRSVLLTPSFEGSPQMANAPECRGEPLPAARRPTAADAAMFSLVTSEEETARSVIAKGGEDLARSIVGAARHPLRTGPVVQHGAYWAPSHLRVPARTASGHDPAREAP